MSDFYEIFESHTLNDGVVSNELFQISLLILDAFFLGEEGALICNDGLFKLKKTS